MQKRDDDLPRNDWGTSRMRGANLRGHEGRPRDDNLPRSERQIRRRLSPIQEWW
jgi:hypothetical protein